MSPKETTVIVTGLENPLLDAGMVRGAAQQFLDDLEDDTRNPQDGNGQELKGIELEMDNELDRDGNLPTGERSSSFLPPSSNPSRSGSESASTRAEIGSSKVGTLKRARNFYHLDSKKGK